MGTDDNRPCLEETISLFLLLILAILHIQIIWPYEEFTRGYMRQI